MLTRHSPSRTLVNLFAVAAAISVASPHAVANDFGPPPGAKLSIAKLAPIQSFVDSEIEAGRIPGAIVLIQRHGQPIYRQCFGRRNLESGTPMAVDAVFRNHSVPKTLASMAPMR